MESDQLENRLYCEILDGESLQSPTVLDSSMEGKDTKNNGLNSVSSGFLHCCARAWKALRSCEESYVFLAVAAAVATAVNATCIKRLSDSVSVFQMVAVRAVFGIPILILKSTSSGYSLLGPKTKMHLCLLRAFFATTGFFCWIYAISMLPLSESAFISNSYPAVTALLSWFLGMEQLGIWSWLGVLGCVAGNLLVAHPPFLHGGGHEDWNLERISGLLAAGSTNFLMALNFIVVTYLGTSVTSVALTFYIQILSLLSSLPFAIAGYPRPLRAPQSILDYICYIGVIHSGVPVQLLITRAFQIGPPTKVTSIFVTNMLLSGVLGILLLSETKSWISAIGSIVVLISVLTVTMQKS